MFAAERGQVKCMQALLDVGAEVHHQDTEGKDAMRLADEKNYVDCIKALEGVKC